MNRLTWWLGALVLLFLALAFLSLVLDFTALLVFGTSNQDLINVLIVAIWLIWVVYAHRPSRTT